MERANKSFTVRPDSFSLFELKSSNAFAPAALYRVVEQQRTFGKAKLCYYEYFAFIARYPFRCDNFIGFLQLNPAYTSGYPAHSIHFAFHEANAHAILSDEKQFFRSITECDSKHFITFSKLHGCHSGRSRRFVFLQIRPFHLTAFTYEYE